MVHRGWAALSGAPTHCSDKAQIRACDAALCGPLVSGTSVTCSFQKEWGLGGTGFLEKSWNQGASSWVNSCGADQVPHCRISSLESQFPTCFHRWQCGRVVRFRESWPSRWGLSTGCSTEKLLSRKSPVIGEMFTPTPRPRSFSRGYWFGI